MNFSKLREKPSFVKSSKILLIIFGLIFIIEHTQYAYRIVQHIHTCHYNLAQILAPQQGPTTAIEDRFKEIKKMNLKPTVAVTYIGDNEPNRADMFRDYFLTRYALVPLMLKFGEEHDTVVCNFPYSLSIKNPKNPLAGDDRWTIISDNGKGALLLVKKKEI